MIQLLQVTNSTELNIDFKQICEEAFPPNERRDWKQLTEIRANERGKGLGTQVIRQILARIPAPVILEVEEPFTDVARKRISFYEQLNFSVSEGDYYQPPYSIGKNKVKMLLMSYAEKLKTNDFTEIKSRIHQSVYHFKE
jgi:hypothetical protein